MAIGRRAMENLVTRPAYLKTFDGAKVLLTGHTGFKGAWLSLWLKSLGAHVTGYALPLDDGSSTLFSAARTEQDVCSIFADLRSFEKTKSAVDQTRPEIIFHLGAQSLVRKSYAEPVDTYATNVMGTVNLLEAARHCPETRAVVIVTSDKCYQNHEKGDEFSESDPMGGDDPYSSSKGCAELVTHAYRQSFYNNPENALIASARAGNVIGGGDWCEDRLIPDIVRAVQKNQPVDIRNPDSVRPWQHVLEPLRGYLMLGAKLLQGDRACAEGWNFGPERKDAIPVQQIAERFVKILGQGSVQISGNPDRLHEARLLTLNTDKAASRLGFKPVLNMTTTLELTANWYREYLENPERARALCLSQLQHYTSLLL